MRQHQLHNGTIVFVPDICDRHAIPYVLGNFSNQEAELLNMFDPASISVTMSKKLGIPVGRLRCWLNSANTNSIAGTLVHDEVKDGEEVECAGYILTSYCGFSVQIMVLCTKGSEQNWLKYQ